MVSGVSASTPMDPSCVTLADRGRLAGAEPDTADGRLERIGVAVEVAPLFESVESSPSDSGVKPFSVPDMDGEG